MLHCLWLNGWLIVGSDVLFLYVFMEYSVVYCSEDFQIANEQTHVNMVYGWFSIDNMCGSLSALSSSCFYHVLNEKKIMKCLLHWYVCDRKHITVLRPETTEVG